MIFRLILIGSFLFSLSCQREPRKSPEGYTDVNQIESAQSKALSKLDPYTVELGQRIHMIETQEVVSTSGPAKFVSKEWITEVTDVENFPDARYLTTLKTVNDKVLDENFFYEFKNVYGLRQIASVKLLDQLNENAYAVQSIVKQLKEDSEVKEADISGVAYQNLLVQTVSLVPPELVKNAENCKNIKSCRLEAELITYDIVFLLADQTTQRHKVEWFISADVPFFAGIMKQCATTVLPVDNSRVLVKQCREVVDFDQ